MALSLFRSLSLRVTPIQCTTSYLTEFSQTYWCYVRAEMHSQLRMLKRFMSKKCPCGQKKCKGKKKKKCGTKEESKHNAKDEAGEKKGKNGKSGKNGKQENLAAVLYGKNDLRLEQRPIQKPKYGEVLLAMDTVGICGSDVHYLKHGRIGKFVVKKPMVIGHEGSAIVAEVGDGVRHLKQGDRCAIEPGVCCRLCDFCKSGKYNLCPRMRFCATPPHHGNLAQYFKHAADFCYKLPDHVTMEEGALLEPLAVGVHACRRAGVGLGSNVLILGAGPIGLVTLTAAKACGAATVTITDMNEHRLLVAKEMGATHAVLMCKKPDAKRVSKELRAIIGTTPDKTIDSVGSKKTIRLAVFATRSAGKCVIVGMSSKKAKLPLLEALTREVDIKGAFRYCNDYRAALSLISSGKTKIKRLITHHYDMKDTKEAFNTVQTGKDKPIKVLIHVQKRDKNNKDPFKNK